MTFFSAARPRREVNSKERGWVFNCSTMRKGGVELGDNTLQGFFVEDRHSTMANV